MNEFTRHINRILTFLLSLLGFSSCFPVMEYGCPTASFRIFGTVKDEKMNPLPNVQIESKSYGYGIRNKDLSELDFPMRTQSDEDGKYEIMELVSCDYEHRDFLLRICLDGYEILDTLVVFDNPSFSGGKKQHEGTTQKEVEIVLKENSKD